jgi:hypothetical protein
MTVSSVYVVVALWLLRTTVLEVMEDSIDDIIPVVNAVSGTQKCCIMSSNGCSLAELWSIHKSKSDPFSEI